MTTPEERAERLRALTAELRGSVAEVQRASQEARAAIRDFSRTAVTGTPEYQRLEREVAETFRSGRSGPAARALQERVDRGELTWRQIREGTGDPAASRLYQEHQSALLDEMARVKRDVEEADAAAERAVVEHRRERDDDEEQPMTILRKRTGRSRDKS
jgi:type II secretory pathway component PulM